MVEEAGTGICALCGPVKIKVRGGRTGAARYSCQVLNGGHQRRYQISSYGLSNRAYEALYESQGRRCKICRTEARLGGVRGLFVDHDHQTGQIRGLLCRRCNTGIGLFKDDPKLIRRAARYVDIASQQRIPGIDWLDPSVSSSKPDSSTAAAA